MPGPEHMCALHRSTHACTRARQHVCTVVPQRTKANVSRASPPHRGRDTHEPAHSAHIRARNDQQIPPEFVYPMTLARTHSACEHGRVAFDPFTRSLGRGDGYEAQAANETVASRGPHGDECIIICETHCPPVRFDGADFNS